MREDAEREKRKEQQQRAGPAVAGQRPATAPRERSPPAAPSAKPGAQRPGGERRGAAPAKGERDDGLMTLDCADCYDDDDDLELNFLPSEVRRGPVVWPPDSPGETARGCSGRGGGEQSWQAMCGGIAPPEPSSVLLPRRRRRLTAGRGAAPRRHARTPPPRSGPSQRPRRSARPLGSGGRRPSARRRRSSSSLSPRSPTFRASARRRSGPRTRGRTAARPGGSGRGAGSARRGSRWRPRSPPRRRWQRRKPRR